MSKEESVSQRLMELQELEETIFLADFHQLVMKARQKSWHDRHIKTKVFVQGDKVLLYESSVPEASWQVAHALVGIIYSCGDLTFWSSQTCATGYYVMARMGEWCSHETLYVSN
jgi:hypothetical protein